jgi:hypothetical protein
MPSDITLADRLIEAAHSYRGVKEIRDDFVYVAAKISTAQRFIVSDDARGAIRSLLTSRPSTLIEAARFARLPFERCWFEWAPPLEQNIHPGQIQVRRCGALMDADGKHGFTIFTAWEFDRKAKRTSIDAEIERQFGPKPVHFDDSLMPNFGVSALVGAYDFSTLIGAERTPVDERFWFQQRALTREDIERQRDDERNGVRHAMKDPKEWEALLALSQLAFFRVHHEAHGFEKITEQEALTGDVGSIVHDVQDEMGHLFATLILMNSKNGVELTKTEPPEKLNQARSKQGKSKLLPYSTVRIKLTNSQQRAVDEGRITRAEARRHPVRGHFKVRATGVFWWNEAWRGSAARGTVQRRIHVVEA